MEIGIIGEGKMGKEIFNLLFQFDYKLILKCSSSEVVCDIRALFEKQVNKMQKRGLLDDAAYRQKMQSFAVTSDASELKNCDIIIEAVFENKALKQDIFGELEPIVKPECILATNTSSIPIDIIFAKCNNKDRCLGTHFFFPVRVTRTVEINTTEHTAQKNVETMKNLFERADKCPLVLKNESNMILTRMLTTILAETCKIYDENYLPVKEIDNVLKENLVTFGLFEILDSTGWNIITESTNNMINDRYRKLYTPFYNKGTKLMGEGYPGTIGNKGLVDYEQDHQMTFKKLDGAELDRYKQNILLRIQSLFINEAAFIVQNKYAEGDQISKAAQEVFGLSEDPISILKRVGHQKITACLTDSYLRYQDSIYEPNDLTVLDI